MKTINISISVLLFSLCATGLSYANDDIKNEGQTDDLQQESSERNEQHTESGSMNQKEVHGEEANSSGTETGMGNPRTGDKGTDSR